MSKSRAEKIPDPGCNKCSGKGKYTDTGIFGRKDDPVVSTYEVDCGCGIYPSEGNR
jgi:hypothetical protein